MLHATSESASSRQLHELAADALSRYALPDGISSVLLSESENAVFRVQARDGGTWALRIHRAGNHAKQAIESEVEWLLELRRAGFVTVPRPLKNMRGEMVQTIGLPGARPGRHAVLFDWEQGIEPQWESDLTANCERLGEVAAHLHQHVRQWRRPAWFTRQSWDFEASLGEENARWGRWRDGRGIDAGRAELFGRAAAVIGKRLAAYGKGPERFGLIHADLRLANLLVEGKTLKVIDFDDCGFGWFMYDAATLVSFYEHEPGAPALIESWKRGYRRVLPLSREDEAEIPTFVMLRRLLLVAWIGSHRDTALAKSLGHPYTDGTVALCEGYLRKFG